MFLSSGRGRAAAGIVALAAFLAPTGAFADDVPLPPNLKALKQAHAKAQAREAARVATSTTEDEPTEIVVTAQFKVPLPPARPKSLDAGTVAETVDDEQTTVVVRAPVPAGRADIHALVNEYAARHGVPERLAHRVVMRESRYNPQAKGGPHYGLMQISLPTARQMGYSGPANGLFDARTNLAHGMPYLANAWLVAGGNETRAVAFYSRGYYYDAKRQGLLKNLRHARSEPSATLEVAVIEKPDNNGQ